VIRIGGRIRADSQDRFYIYLRPESCTLEHLSASWVVTTGGDIRPEGLSFRTTPDVCHDRTIHEWMEWDQVSIAGSMDYSIEYEAEYSDVVTFQFTDFQIVLDEIESVDPPKFSSVTLNGTYRVPVYRCHRR
jgi:hypothetical protein